MTQRGRGVWVPGSQRHGSSVHGETSLMAIWPEWQGAHLSWLKSRFVGGLLKPTNHQHSPWCGILGCASWCEPAPALGQPLPGAVIAEATASKPAEVTGTREEGSWDTGKTQSAGTDSPGISPAGIPPHPGLNACAVLLKETHLSLSILQP